MILIFNSVNIYKNNKHMQKRLPDTCLEATFACVIFLMLFDTLVNLVTK